MAKKIMMPVVLAAAFLINGPIGCAVYFGLCFTKFTFNFWYKVYTKNRYREVTSFFELFEV